MGLYHYTKYVYEAKMRDATEDFHTYLYSDLHGFCAEYVQMLRVDEYPKVPMLKGWSVKYPGSNEKRKELFAMTMLIMFHPTILPAELTRATEKDIREECSAMLDNTHSYIEEWERWHKSQCVLAKQYHQLETENRQGFSLESIDTSLGATSAVAGRKQPSAAEYMAAITVRRVHFLTMKAEAQSTSSSEAKVTQRMTERGTMEDVTDADGAPQVLEMARAFIQTCIKSRSLKTARRHSRYPTRRF